MSEPRETTNAQTFQFPERGTRSLRGVEVPMPRFTDPEIYAICDDPRPSTDVAKELRCSEALIRHVRLKLIYVDAPRPRKMPSWRKGGGRTSLRGEESPQAVLTWVAVMWLRRMKAKDLGLRTTDLAKMVTKRFKLKRVLCDRTVRDAINEVTWRRE